MHHYLVEVIFGRLQVVLNYIDSSLQPVHYQCKHQDIFTLTQPLRRRRTHTAIELTNHWTAVH